MTAKLGLIVGLADTVLIYALATRWFGRRAIGLAAGVILFLTPAHAYFSRTAPPQAIWPLPFLLGWALIVSAIERQRPRVAKRMLPSAVVLLVAAVLVQPSVALLAGAFAVLTLVIVGRASGVRVPAAAIAGGAIVVCGVSMALLVNPIASFRAVAWQRAATVANWFWTFWLPSNLFVSAEPLPSCGVFLSCTAVPMAVGVYTLGRDMVNGPPAVESLIIAIGSIAAALAGAMAGPPPVITRALIVVPFGVLLTVSGAIVMWTRWRLAGRAILIALAVGGAVQSALCL